MKALKILTGIMIIVSTAPLLMLGLFAAIVKDALESGYSFGCELLDWIGNF